MAIPEFQAIMLPFLKKNSDGQEHTTSEMVEQLAEEFHLTQEDRDDLLPSGTQRRFDNRVGWVKTHLTKACLIDLTGRGRFRITARGKQVLEEQLSSISCNYLMRFPEYAEFHKASKKTEKMPEESKLEEENHQTPEELLESSYQTIRANLAQELLDRVMKMSPRFFEQLVVDLLLAMGYGGSRKDAGTAIGQSGDGGIDGIIKEDKLGLDVVYIQAKRWEGTVGRPTVQAFAGSIEGQRARKGVLITTSKFTADAREYINRIEKKIVLIDGEQLAQLMIDHNVGVNEVASYVVKRVDLDFFGEE